MMRIAVTGANGNLGTELVKLGCVPLNCDVTDIHQVREAVEDVEPDIIINASAKSGVDACETKEGMNEATAVNTRGIAHLREIYDGQIIHISTSYVFNGKRGPYKENARANPIQGYGYSKWGGEVIFQSYLYPTDVIVRTVGLYGGKKKDFTDLVIGNLLNGIEVRALTNLKFNPTYVPHLAKSLVALTEYVYPPKIVNIAGKNILTRYEFARKIADEFGLDKDLIVPTEYVDGWVAERPKKSGLRTNLARKMKIPIYTVSDGVKELKRQWESRLV